MKLFNSAAEAAFKKDPDGEGWLFYTNGILSKGRIVNDIETKENLFKFQKQMYMFALPILFLLGALIDNLLILAILVFVVLLLQHLKVKNLPISTHKLKFKESASIGLKGLPSWYHKLCYTFSGITIIFGLSLPIIFNKPFSEIMSITFIMIGMGVIVFFCGLMVQKLRANNTP